jgi:hypothetical protein
MADEARSIRSPGLIRQLAANTVTQYECWQTPTGKAGVYDTPTAVSSGNYFDMRTDGAWTFVKTAGFVALKGNRAYWDHSANAVTYRKVNDRDFYIGRFAEDASSAATSCVVELNEDPPYDLDICRDPYLSVFVGTQGLNTMGIFRRGGAHKFILSSTNEAQKMDILTKDGFALAANAIIEFAVDVISDGAGTAVDVSIGAANATDSDNADDITDSVFMHLNANDVNIYFESDDGSTEVAATDSTIDYTEGTRFEVWMDFRDPASVKMYVNGSAVLTGTTFDVSASVATLKLLAHIEKTAAADTYELDLEWFRAHYAEQ